MGAKGKSRKIKRRLPAQRRSRDLVSAILQATAHVLEAEGYARCTTNRIAERAGVSIGSVYQYFPNKEALLAAVLSRELEQNVAVFDALTGTARDAPPDDELDPVIAGMVKIFFEKRKLFRILLEDAPASVRTHGLLKNRRHFVETLGSRIGAEGTRHEGASAEMIAFIVVHAIVGTLHGTVLAGGGPSFAPETLSRELTRLVRNYLR